MSTTINNLRIIEEAVALLENDNLKSDFSIYVAAFKKIIATQQTTNSPSLDPTRVENLNQRIKALEEKEKQVKLIQEFEQLAVCVDTEAAIFLQERNILKIDFSIFVAQFEKICASQKTPNSPSLDPTLVENLNQRIKALENKKKHAKTIEKTDFSIYAAALNKILASQQTMSLPSLDPTRVEKLNKRIQELEKIVTSYKAPTPSFFRTIIKIVAIVALRIGLYTLPNPRINGQTLYITYLKNQFLPPCQISDSLGSLCLLHLGKPTRVPLDLYSQEMFLKYKGLLTPLIEEGKLNPYEITSTFLNGVDLIVTLDKNNNLIQCLQNGIIPIKGFLNKLAPSLTYIIVKHIDKMEFLAKEGFYKDIGVTILSFEWLNLYLEYLNINDTKYLLENKESLDIPLDLRTILTLQGRDGLPRAPLEVIAELLEAGNIGDAQWVADVKISGRFDYRNMPPSVQRAFYGKASSGRKDKPPIDREFPILSAEAQTLLGLHTSQPNDYEVLGILKTATAKDIKAAHRTLARKYHPDRNKNPNAQEISTRINGAWDALKS